MRLRAGGRIERRQRDVDILFGHVARDANEPITVIGIRPLPEALRRMEYTLHALHEGDLAAVLHAQQSLHADQLGAELRAGEPRPGGPACPRHWRRRPERVRANAGEVLAPADPALGIQRDLVLLLFSPGWEQRGRRV